MVFGSTNTLAPDENATIESCFVCNLSLIVRFKLAVADYSLHPNLNLVAWRKIHVPFSTNLVLLPLDVVRTPIQKLL